MEGKKGKGKGRGSRQTTKPSSTEDGLKQTTITKKSLQPAKPEKNNSKDVPTKKLSISSETKQVKKEEEEGEEITINPLKAFFELSTYGLLFSFHNRLGRFPKSCSMAKVAIKWYPGLFSPPRWLFLFWWPVVLFVLLVFNVLLSLSTDPLVHSLKKQYWNIIPLQFGWHCFWVYKHNHISVFFVWPLLFSLLKFQREVVSVSDALQSRSLKTSANSFYTSLVRFILQISIDIWAGWIGVMSLVNTTTVLEHNLGLGFTTGILYGSLGFLYLILLSRYVVLDSRHRGHLFALVVAHSLFALWTSIRNVYLGDWIEVLESGAIGGATYLFIFNIFVYYARYHVQPQHPKNKA